MHIDINRSKIKITQKAATFIWVIGTIVEKEVLGASNIKETLFGIAFTEKGDNHIVRIHNAWEHVKKKLQAYAYCELADFESLQSGNIFIDEKGIAIRCIEERSK